MTVALVVGGLVARQYKVSVASPLINIFLISLLVARIAFVLRYFSEYQPFWLSMLDIRDGGFDIATGVITALLLACYYAWRQQRQRRALVAGLIAGAMLWGMTQFALWAIEDKAQQLPQAIVADRHGQSLDVSTVASGKPRAINLWATWCPPCRREMPVLEKAQQQYSQVAFIFVNQGEHQQVIDSFLQQESLSLDNVLADKNAIMGQLIGSRALPTTLFVDAQGQLIDAHLGELSPATLKAKLERVTDTMNEESEDNSL
nr:TlpA disulfide reductase family protein [Kangiella shandongensis]